MSETIDKRIVEMRFNNKDFEKHANESIKTLDQLKKSMEMDNATTSIDKIAQSVEKLEHRFSAMGIVGKRVIENLTDSAMNLLNKTQAFLSGGIISGGIRRAMNLENARFTLNGLLDTVQEAEAVVTIAGKSVDNTAYSLDQAAVIASQFAASGLTAATAENKLEKALRGVAGVAAITNSDYASLGRIFTQISGQGRLMGNDLLQLSTRGMNAAASLTDIFNKVSSGEIEAGDAVTDMGESTIKAIQELTGGLQITETELRDFVSKGEVSFDMFAESMNAAFGDKAQEADKTLTGAFSNVKAALARIGEAFIGPLIEKEGPLVKFLNTTKAKINDFKATLTTSGNKEGGFRNTLSAATFFTEGLNDAIKRLTKRVANMDVSKVFKVIDNIVYSLQNFFHVLRDVRNVVAKAYRDIFPKKDSVGLLTKITNKLASFSEAIKRNGPVMERLGRAFRGFFALLDIGKTALFEFVRILGPDIAKAIAVTLDKLLDFAAWMGDNLVILRNWIKETNVFEKVFRKIHVGLSIVTGGLRAIGSAISTAFSFIVDKIKIFKDAASDGVWSGIKAVATAIVDDFGSLWDKIKEKMSQGWGAISDAGPFRAIKKFLQELKDYFAESEVFKFILDCFESLKAGIQKSIDGFKYIRTEGISGFLEKIKEKFSWLGSLANFFGAVGRLFLKAGKILWSVLKTVGKGIIEALDEFLPSITKGISTIVDNSDAADIGVGIAGGALGLLLERIRKILKPVEDFAKNFEKIGDGITSLLGKVGDVLTAYQKTLKAKAIKSIAESVVMLAGSLFFLAMVPGDDLMKGVVAMSLLMKSLSDIMGSFGKVTSASDQNSSDDKKGIAGFLSKLGTTAITVGAQILMFAGAIAILSVAVAALGSMSDDTLVKGIVTVTILMTALSKMTKKLTGGGKNKSNAGEIAAQSAGTALIIAAIAGALLIILPLIGILGAVMVKTDSGLPAIISGTLLIMGFLLGFVLMIGHLVEKSKEINIKGAFGVAAILLMVAVIIGIMTKGLTALAIASGEFSASGKTMSKNTNGESSASGRASYEGALFGPAFAIIAILGAIGAFIYFMMEATKKYSLRKTQLKTLLTLLAAATAIIAVVGVVLTIMSVLTSEFEYASKTAEKESGGWDKLKGKGSSTKVSAKGGEGLGAVVAALVGALAAIAVMVSTIMWAMKKYKIAPKDMKVLSEMTKTILAVVVVIMAVVYAVTQLSKINGVDELKAVGIIALVSAIMIGIGALAGIAPFIGTGLQSIAFAVDLFAAAAVVFAAAIWIFVNAFKQVSDATEEGIRTAGANIRIFCDEIINSADDMALAFSAVFGAVILAIADAIANGWVAVAKSLIKAAYGVLDELEGNIGPIIGRTAKLILEACDALLPYVPDIIDRLVKVVISVIKGLAAAIRKHDDEIIKAIDDLLGAIARLLGKMIGLSEDKLNKLESFAKKWGKRVLAYLAVVWTTKKILTWEKQAKESINKVGTSMLTAFKTGNQLGGGGFYGFTTGLQNIGVTSETVFGKMLGKLGSIMNFLGPAGTLAVGAGMVVKVFIDAAADAMNVVTDFDKERLDAVKKGAEESKKIADEIYAKYQPLLDEIRNGPKTSELYDAETDTKVEDSIEKLKSLTDMQGLVKSGSEDAAQAILDDLNSAYDLNLSITDGVITQNGRVADSFESIADSINKASDATENQKILEAYSGTYKDVNDNIKEVHKNAADAEKELTQAIREGSNGLYSTYDEWYANINNANFKGNDKLRLLNYFDAVFQKDEGKLVGELGESEWQNFIKLAELYGAEAQYVSKDLNLGDAFKQVTGSDFYSLLEKESEGMSDFILKIEKLHGKASAYRDIYDDMAAYADRYTAYEEALASGNEDLINTTKTNLVLSWQEETAIGKEEYQKQYENFLDSTNDMLDLIDQKKYKATKAEMEQTRIYVEELRKRWIAEQEAAGNPIEYNGWNIDPFKNTLDEIDRNLLNWQEDTKETAKETAKKTGETFTSEFINSISGTADAEKLMNKFGVGNITDLIGKNVGNFDVSSLSKQAQDAFGSVADSGIEGFVSKFDDGIVSIEGITTEGMDSSADAANKALKINSPSKVFMEIGSGVVEGFVKGINGGISTIYPAIGAMATATLNGFNSAIALGSTPTITPIIDLAGASVNDALNAAIGKNNVMSAGLKGMFSTQLAASINVEHLDAEFDRIVESLKTMNDNIVTIGNRVNKLQVVMDTGALVGQLAAPMDGALGGMAMYKRRGI